jgi:serine/threonine protein phosphatase 1
MATIAVGDIHGNLAALDDLLVQIRDECGRGDAIVFLGDSIDRGRDARGCIDAILEFQRTVAAEVVCLRGNHEDWLLRTRHDYRRHSWLLGMEGFDTIRSYSIAAENQLREAVAAAGLRLFVGRCDLPYDAFFDCLPQDHLHFLEDLLLYHQTADCVCTHGGLDPAIARIHDQSRDALIWGHRDFPLAYNADDVVVYGHWNNAAVNADGWPEPVIVGRTIGIDTISHGVLTAVRLPNRRVFQSARHLAGPMMSE